MSIESNESVIRNMMLAIQNGDAEGIVKFIAPNWVNHDPSLPPMQGPEGAKMLVNLWRGLSDTQVVIEDIFSQGDRVAVRFYTSARHTGELMGIPPTGKMLKVPGIGIFRVVDGKATDNWVSIDALGLLQQLGVVPVMPMPA